jgi:hypothetical protein
MEAKVDVRKLQLLNDRITQVMDALNQVRFSVHGLAHSGGFQQPTPYGMGQQQFPFGMGQPFWQAGTQWGQQQPMMGGFGGLQHTQYSPWLQQPMMGGFGGQQQQPMMGGFGGFQQQPMMGGFGGSQQQPMMGGFGGQQQHPMMGGFGGQQQHPMMGGFGGQQQQPMMGGFGGSQHTQYGQGFGGGLYHSPELIEQQLLEQRANDPNRILQTFPYCLAPQSLTGW